MPLDPNMSDSSRDAIKVLTGIKVPRAGLYQLGHASEIYNSLTQRLKHLEELLALSRSHARRHFDGKTADSYERSLDQFTKGENNYVGSAQDNSTVMSTELFKARANVEYMHMMVIGQFIQLLVEIAWAIATAKFTFGASLKWIPVFKAIRSLAMRRILTWLAFTVPSHQILSQIYASMDSIIQRIQIGKGTRHNKDRELTKSSHLGAIGEGLISAFAALGLDTLFGNNLVNLLKTGLKDLHGLPDPPPLTRTGPDGGPPPPGPLNNTPDTPPGPPNGGPDGPPTGPVKDDPPTGPVKDDPPATNPDRGPDTPTPKDDPTSGPPASPSLNQDLATLFTRHNEELLAPYHPGSPIGAGAFDNAAKAAAAREEFADLFARHFGDHLGESAARNLGRDYANTLTRNWNNPALGQQLRQTIGDRLPPHMRDHLADVPVNLNRPLAEYFSTTGAYAQQTGGTIGSGALEGYLGEGLGSVMDGRGWEASVWSATAGASQAGIQQGATDSALHGLDLFSHRDHTPLPPPQTESNSSAGRGSGAPGNGNGSPLFESGSERWDDGSSGENRGGADREDRGGGREGNSGPDRDSDEPPAPESGGGPQRGDEHDDGPAPSRQGDESSPYGRNESPEVDDVPDLVSDTDSEPGDPDDLGPNDNARVREDEDTRAPLPGSLTTPDPAKDPLGTTDTKHPGTSDDLFHPGMNNGPLAVNFLNAITPDNPGMNTPPGVEQTTPDPGNNGGTNTADRSTPTPEQQHTPAPVTVAPPAGHTTPPPASAPQNPPSDSGGRSPQRTGDTRTPDPSAQQSTGDDARSTAESTSQPDTAPAPAPEQRTASEDVPPSTPPVAETGNGQHDTDLRTESAPPQPPVTESGGDQHDTGPKSESGPPQQTEDTGHTTPERDAEQSAERDEDDGAESVHGEDPAEEGGGQEQDGQESRKDAPPATEATTPDTTEGTPVPTRSTATDAPPAPPAAGPDRAADSGPDTPGKAPTDPTASGIDPRADARAASVLDRLPELTRALADNDIPGARALGAEFWRQLRPVEGPDPENRSIHEARTLAQALVYTVSDPSDRRVPLSGESIPAERVRDAEVLARGIGRHLQDRHDPVRARLWQPGGRLTTDYVQYAMQDPADRGPSPYGAPDTVKTVNTALVDGDEDAPAPEGRSEEPPTPPRTATDTPPAQPPRPASGAPPSDRMEPEPGERPADASLLDTFHSALNEQPPPVRSGPVTGEESSDPGDGPPPQPVSARSAPEPNTDDEITVFLMETTDQDPAEEDGHLPEPGATREREDGMTDLLGLEDPAARAAELDDPGTNPHTFDALPRDQRETVVAQAATDWLSSLTWLPSLDTASVRNRLEDLTYDAGDNASSEDLNGWPLYEKNGRRWPTLAEIRELNSQGGNTRTLIRLIDDVFKAPDPRQRLRHWYDNADEAGALARAADGAYPTADQVLDTLRTLDAATDRPLPGPVEVTFALSGDEGLHGLDGYVEGDPSSLVGTEQREAGYLRTSLDRSPATGGDGDGKVLVHLSVPEDGRGLWIGDRAGTSDPYTLLLPRGTGYRVTDVTESDGIVEITAVALPAEPRPVAAPPTEPAAVHDDADHEGDETDDGAESDDSDAESDESDDSDAESNDSDDSDTDTDDRGTLDENGIRRFDSPGEIDRQDRWLQDPANNPHAFDTLTPDQRGMVDAYTRSAWITRVARIRPFLPQNVVRQLMEWRSQSRAEAADPDMAQMAHGWDLYEANGLAWPSVERLRQIAASPQPLPPRTRGLIRYILDAPDPRAELDHWFHNAGYAGVIARLNGGVYPDANAVRRLFRLMDGAVDRPLPEGMAVSRGMQSINHLLRTTGGTDPRALVGTVHTEPGYMSTTLGDSPFKTDADGFPFLLRLDVPQGIRGLWIGTRSHDPEQMELTLGRGTTYRITGVEERIDPESGGPQFVITATVVPLPRAVPDLFSEGSTGEDGVRRFWNAEEAHWYGHRLHDPAHNPHAVNALPRARHDLARALSALAGGFDHTRTDPDGARQLLDSLRAASHVTPASTPAEQQRLLGWELYEANGLTWPSPQRLLQLLPAERVRNPARAQFITGILRHGPQEAARRLNGLYNAAGPAGVLARANGGTYPSPERLLDMLASYEDAVRRPLPDAVESTWYLDQATARRLHGFDPRDPSALVGTEQTTRGYTAVALNPRPVGPGEGPAAVVRLVLPPGAHGLWLGGAGPRPHNQEIVLPPGTRFQIDSVDTSGDRPVITARVHAPADDTATPAVVNAPPAAGDAPDWTNNTATGTAPDGTNNTATGTAPDGTNNTATGPDTLRAGHEPGDGRGHVDGNGIRRFRTEEELDAYDLWLHDPANNPHAFAALSPEHRNRITGYTIDGWLNTVARNSMDAERVGIVLDLMRQDTVASFETNPMGSRGWELYEMNDLAWPTLDRLRELLEQGRVPERAEGFVRYILDAPDPQEELDNWHVRAGEAGEVARSSDDAFPPPERTLEHLRTLTEAIDRPMPEGIEVIRGLEELDHLEGFDGKDPYSLVGTVHTERGFMSTSLGHELAGVTSNYAHALHLTLPRGSRGVWIGSESRHPEEREMILPPGTTYRITRAGWGGSRGLEGLYIEAEVIVPERPVPEPDQAGTEESADLHVFTAETDTDATVTGPDEPGLGADAEAGMAALLGLEDSGHESDGDDAYDDRPLLDRDDSDDEAPTGPAGRTDRAPLDRTDDGGSTVAAPETRGGEDRGFRTREELDAYAERMEDRDGEPHTYGALPPELRALIGEHTAYPWLSNLARLGTSDPAVIQDRLDFWSRTSLDNASDPDDPNGWVLYEANDLSWPSLSRVRELYAGGGRSPAFKAIAADIFGSSDPQLRLDHWYENADDAGEVARANGGVYPTGDRALEIIRDMDAAVDQPLPGPIAVSFVLDVGRDLPGLHGYDSDDSDDPTAMVGRDQREQGYTTVSLGDSPFTTAPNGTVAVVRMVLPEDARGLWIGDQGATGDRYALVLPRDFGYRITDVRITDGGMEIDAEPVSADMSAREPSAEDGDDDSDASTVADEESRPPAGDGRGHIGDDGYRRFRALGELDAYDQWLQDPTNNPHAFDTLTPDQRGMVDAYTRSAWITRLARVRPLSPTGVARQLALVRGETQQEAEQPATVTTAHGWDLYEANELTWPTLDRLREIRANPEGLPPRTVGLIDYVLTARDPAAELRHWFHNAGYAGVIARHNGGTYPDVDRVLELFRLLDDATGSPLPEGLVVSRGMHSIDHLLQAAGVYDADDLEGTVHTEPGYMSTTLGDRPFKTDAAPFRYLLRLNVPQDAHGLWIGSRSHDPEQRELTLARGSTYRITGVRETFDMNTGGIVTVLSAEVVLRPEAFADPLSDGRVDASGVRRFRTPTEAHWYAHQAAHAESGMPGLDTLPAEARRVAKAFSNTPLLADLALVPPGDMRTQLDRLRSMSRPEQPSIADSRGSSGWEVYEANGLTWPTPERLREIVDAAEEGTPGTHFLRMVLALGRPEERLASLYHRSGMAGALAAANGGTYPSAEGVRDLLETYDEAVGRPLPEAVETTWVLTDTDDLRFPEGYDERDPSGLVGTVQSSPGYTTVSVNPEPKGLGHPAATVRLTLPEGAHGLWLGTEGPRPSNHEIVLPRGMSYRVTGAETTADGLLLTAEAILPVQADTASGARPPAVEEAPPATGGGTGQGTAAPDEGTGHTAPPGEATGHTATPDASATDAGLPVGTGTADDDGRGYVDDLGVRRFRSVEETDAYGRWLHDPSNNPHAFDSLHERQRGDVRSYTAAGWLNEVVRENLSAEQVQNALDEVREATHLETNTDPMEARGWSLYELNDLSWPTVERLRELLAQDRVPEHTAGFVRYILDAPDPEAELAGWHENAGGAGVLARSNGDVFPTTAEVAAFLDRLDRAVDRPLPETVEMVRGLYEVSFLDGYQDLNPYSLVGTVQTEPGFMSASLGNKLAGHHQTESGNVIHLTVPAGSRGLWVGERSEYPKEREVILARGTTYRITRAGWGGASGLPGFHIEAEVVVPPPETVPAPQQRAGDTSDVQVLTVRTDTDTTVTGPEQTGLSGGTEAFLTALLGLDDAAASAEGSAGPPESGTQAAGPDLPEDRPGRVDPDGVRRFATDGDGAGYGKLVLGDRFPSLSPEQQNSARAYTKNGQFYNDFSRNASPESEVLRLSEQRFFGSWVEKWFDGHTPSRENAEETWGLLREGMDVLDRAMEPVPETVEVRRSVFGVGFMAPPGQPFHDPTDLIGTEFLERGFLSGSLGVETVNRTAAYQFHLAVPAGHPALWIGDGSVHRSERELLLPRGTRFRIDDALQDPGTGQWTLRVTVLPFTPRP
ncbi:ADP-ribosyltransferase [Nocardiopsis sp. HUAS JQ3]|uniref:ADP-ribosyltransferase n=1 Tax=Nocardiopsis sp. HUAS JQ3 TaxID=3061629 RepID=UPI0023A91533|nr:ADP-ribosyltransferase [Nocardiopsis sp. HUAS JQ3]WDZ90774.1 ADP-ribosyltransferase [Nocardiopsis sp. HUAS JQ3]